jgi:transglutaminase-like putative cysteine protease
MKRLRQTDPRIPRKPLLWLSAGLLFTVPPLFSSLASWIAIFFLATLIAKFWMEPRGYRIRSIVLKLVLAGAGVTAVFVTYGSLGGMEPGVSLIVVLMALKILEAHTVRELRVMIMISWILCLCGLVLSQELGTALWLGAAFLLTVVALVQFQQGPATRSGMSVRETLKLLARALPLVVVLFVAFPRFNTGFRLQLSKTGGAATGFSGTLSPSSITSLANSSTIAFRVQFPSGNIPALANMYWRGLVLRDCQGLEWRSPEAPAAVPRSSWRKPDKNAVRQLITIEPHGGHWLFALDSPIAPPPGVLLAPGNYLWSFQTIRSARQYEVTSMAGSDASEMRPRELAIFSSVPPWVSPAVRGLVASWKQRSANPRAIAQQGLEFFRDNDFRYSLSPGDYQPDDLDEFLFRRRAGFCEHYAAAFATLMRVAGIPARTVTGYLGGEYNDLGQFIIVRQSDAHAWCELWFAEAGWQRVDPTSAVAPERLTLGFNGYMQARAAAGDPGSVSTQRRFFNTISRNPVLNRIRLGWQSLNYEWETRIVSYDAEAQESVLARLINQSGGILRLGWATFLSLAAMTTLYLVWRSLRRFVRQNTVTRLYQRYCKKAADLGAVRDTWEGPADFSRRAARVIPEHAPLIEGITRDYIALRYAREPDRKIESSFAAQVNAFNRVR